MAFGDPPQDASQGLWDVRQSPTLHDLDPEGQWVFQFGEHLLLTVQAIHRLRLAFSSKIVGGPEEL